MPKKVYLQGILLHYFIQKKYGAEVHRILVENYGVPALSKTICSDWFSQFKNNDFDVEDKEHSGTPKSLKTKKWRHYFMMAHVTHKLNFQNHVGDCPTVLKCLKH